MKIELKHVTKKFPNRDRKIHEFVVAAQDLNFEIPDGKLVCLLGPSGCGKSTALNLICGLEAPTEGAILFDGENVTDLPPEKRGIGMVFQSYALYPHLTVRQNIMFPLQNLKGDKKLTKEEMKAKVDEAARIVQIDELMARKPKQMSGGQQQRVAIARALVKRPSVLLLDEPLSNLDARLRIQTREEIRRIQKETGITTVFVTHDQEEAMSISDVIVVMKKGLVYQIGEPQAVYDDPDNLFVAKFLGTPPINVFGGEVKDGELYVGNDKVLPVKLEGIENRRVFVGVRPEGFVLEDNDTDNPYVLHCKLKSVEVMGRDISLVARHHAMSEGADLRAIVSSDEAEKAKSSESICLSLKPSKVCLFDRETEKRVPFEFTGITRKVKKYRIRKKTQEEAKTEEEAKTDAEE